MLQRRFHDFRHLRCGRAPRLTTGHVHTTAQCLNVSDRTVWRRLADATTTPDTATHPGARRSDRFEITPPIRVLLAYWHGNASAVHRELVARATTTATAAVVTAGDAAAPTPTPPTDNPLPGGAPFPGGAPRAAVPLLDPLPSLSTFLRALRRDLTAGERVGHRKGPEAARALDVFAKRPRTWRNHTWEADHVQASLRVTAGGDLVHPYVTWFIDCATKAITGAAVTPGYPTRASVLAALRSAIVRTAPYGPFGGLPEHVRFDRGRNFLSRTVSIALTALDADITVLPPYSPHLKGGIENLNHCVERMLFAALPGHTPKHPRRRPDRTPTGPALHTDIALRPVPDPGRRRAMARRTSPRLPGVGLRCGAVGSGVETLTVVLPDEVEVVRTVTAKFLVPPNEDVECLVKRAARRFSDRLERGDDPVLRDVTVNALGDLFHGPSAYFRARARRQGVCLRWGREEG
ncbi:transposase family protein [Embleya sp. NBC_00888]|uniref:integrase catalytic domain-containing protein n=1 Tax=Embleya sp. NBC_00888 TaxID=2975960 RepID=UPI00386F1F45|nr:transposase family protein [Embleya sp. NBC_00888]